MKDFPDFIKSKMNHIDSSQQNTKDMWLEQALTALIFLHNIDKHSILYYNIDYIAIQDT